MHKKKLNMTGPLDKVQYMYLPQSQAELTVSFSHPYARCYAAMQTQTATTAGHGFLKASSAALPHFLQTAVIACTQVCNSAVDAHFTTVLLSISMFTSVRVKVSGSSPTSILHLDKASVASGVRESDEK
mmetsp:Transcript_24159/g.43588  ORF Transcript_24159/g.43588 Transcript_24159/m.43588 type:complete len:129 (-) Transcript_24159:2059-2445(-)